MIAAAVLVSVTVTERAKHTGHVIVPVMKAVDSHHAEPVLIPFQTCISHSIVTH